MLKFKLLLIYFFTRNLINMLYRDKICPHCKSHFSFFQLLYLKDKSTFNCFFCKKKCFVVLNKGIKFLAIFLVVSGLIFIAFSVVFLKKYLPAVFLLTILFLAFYVLVPKYLFIKSETKSNNKMKSHD